MAQKVMNGLSIINGLNKLKNYIKYDKQLMDASHIVVLFPPDGIDYSLVPKIKNIGGPDNELCLPEDTSNKQTVYIPYAQLMDVLTVCKGADRVKIEAMTNSPLILTIYSGGYGEETQFKAIIAPRVVEEIEEVQS